MSRRLGRQGMRRENVLRIKRSNWLVMVLGAVLLAGPLIGDAFARKPKPLLSATVNDKRLKSSKRGIVGLYATTSFSVNGATKVKRGLVRSITVNCGPVNIKAVPLPNTLTSCYGAYSESRSKGGPAFKQWTGTAVELAVDSFDGSRIVGRFRGTLDIPQDPGDPPAAVEDGTFSLVFIDTGV